MTDIPKLTPPQSSTISMPSLRGALIDCAARGQLPQLTEGLTPRQLELLLKDWGTWGRLDQLPPKAAPNGRPWTTWAIIGGRGAGKTRAGAEWVRGMALGLKGFADRPARRIALIGETAGDVRDVMVEGVSGILSVHGRGEQPRWEPSLRKLTWKTGAVAQCFSAEEPESLRGPQFSAAWCDELAKWRRGEAVYDMLQFALRLGARPRQLITTTPRPMALLKRILADPSTAVSKAGTKKNAANLAPDFLARVTERYAGTRLGRQEIDGEIVEETQGALWSRSQLETLRVDLAPALQRIVIAVDPSAASHRRADACGIVAAGICGAGVIYVVADATRAAARPATWAAAAVALYHKLEADALVAEVNQGGEMVASVIAQVDAGVPVKSVRATRGKYLRAAPVAQLYEQGRVRHVGAFPALEDELCAFGPEGLAGGRSPDRLDALVWAVSELALKPARAEPRMRRV